MNGKHWRLTGFYIKSLQKKKAMSQTDIGEFEPKYRNTKMPRMGERWGNKMRE